MVILDTDVISSVMRGDARAVAWLDRQSISSVWTTTITIFELRYGLSAMPAGRRQMAQETAFRELVDRNLEGRVLPFDLNAAEEAALLLAERRRSGRMREARDTMIAGIALAQNATLATRNVRHFDDLRVQVVDPWDV